MPSEYNIPFVGLKNGLHSFDFTIEKTFFETLDYFDFSKVDIRVNLELTKKEQLLELHFYGYGAVEVPCDISTELFDLPIETQMQMIVKFGSAFESPSEEIMILPHGTYQIDVTQQIYEMIILAVPQKKIHPQVADGTLKSAILDKLKLLAPKEQNTSTNDQTDPRWDQLKKLL